jgi:hypothetical protein
MKGRLWLYLCLVVHGVSYAGDEMEVSVQQCIEFGMQKERPNYTEQNDLEAARVGVEKGCRKFIPSACKSPDSPVCLSLTGQPAASPSTTPKNARGFSEHDVALAYKNCLASIQVQIDIKKKERSDRPGEDYDHDAFREYSTEMCRIKIRMACKNFDVAPDWAEACRTNVKACKKSPEECEM